MKKLITTVFVFLLFTQVSFAVDYYTAGSQDPNNVNNWWTNTNGTGSHPANFTTAGNLFNIQSGHTMTGASLWTVSGTGSKVIIKTGGQLTSGAFNHSIVNLEMESGAIYLCNHTTYSGITFGTLNSASTVELAGATVTPRTASITYGNFTWNSAGSTSLSSSINIAGDLTCKGAGELRLTNATNGLTHTVGGNIIISGGTLVGSQGAGSPAISVGKGFQMTSGTYKSQNSSGIATFNFGGTGTINISGGTVTNSNQIINFNSGSTVTFASNWTQTTSAMTVASGGIVDLSTFVVSGTGSFIVASGGALRIGSTTGIATAGATGNVQTSTRTFNAAGIYTYNGGSAQITGTALPTSLTANLTISNTAGVTLTNSTSNTATNTVSGLLILGTNTFTGTGGAAVLAGSGTIRLDGVLATQITGYNSNTFQTNGTYNFNGGASQDVPTGTYGGLTVNGGGATMTGDVTVSGTLALNGTFTVGTNTLTISNPITVTPTNLVTDQTSALVINGSAANIHIPSSVTQLDDLEMNNSNVVVADGNIRIRSLCALTNGVLNMGANTLEIGHSTALVGSLTRVGGGVVRGAIKRWFATSTPTIGTIFPVSNYHWITGQGFGDDYNEVAISFTTGGPSTGGSLTVRFDTTGSGTLFDNGGLGYIDVGAQWPGVNFINLSPQYWTITPDDGLAGFTYDITLIGNGMNVSTVATLFTGIVKRTNNTLPWAWTFANHVNTQGSSTPVLGGQGFTTFSEFAIGGNVDNPLPVELSSFTSSVSGKNVTLNWSTITETNNSGFDIERKSLSASWTKIGNVEGNGTVTTPVNYTFSDKNLNTGNYSYRLKQVDFNGNYKYFDLSNEVIIGTPSKYALSQNFPNPFNPSTSISYEIPATNFVSLKIYDMMGREVANLVSGNQEAGFYTVKFDASKLSSGIYFYKLQANDFSATKKLMLLK